MLTSIDKYTPERFPDIHAEKVSNPNIEDAKELYEFLQQYMVDSIGILYNAKDKIINLFLIDIVTEILNMDKLYCKSDITVIDDIEVGDEDAIGNNDFKDTVGEDDEGFIDQDAIDYDQDPDEIPDSQLKTIKKVE